MKRKKGRKAGIPTPESNRIDEADLLAVSGAIAGATTGAVAGPPGVAAGAVIGAAAGLAAGLAMERRDRQQAIEDEKLDEDIGVIGGDLGAASEKAPPARIGAFSSGSAGAGPSSGPPSEGPLQDVDE